MKLWILRYELAPATIAKIANRTTWGRRYSLPSARRGSSISANSVRNGVNCMATSARPIRVACQRVRDFASQESSIALPSATLPAGVAIWTRPSSTERCTAVYLTCLCRPEHVVHFFREVVGVPVITKDTLRQRTNDYQSWVEAFARNHRISIQWPEKGTRKEDYVQRWLRRMERKNAYGVYFIFKSMEVGSTFRITVPKYPTKDPNYRIIANQRSRFTH